MPLYELRENAENRIRVSPAAAKLICTETKTTIAAIVEAFKSSSQKTGRIVTAAFEGMYGIDWAAVMAELARAAKEAHLALTVRDASGLYRSAEQIAAYKKPFLSDDPGFGLVNDAGRIEDIMDPGNVQAVAAEIAAHKAKKGNGAFVVFGPGAMAASSEAGYDLVFYFDSTRQTVLWQM